MPEKTDLRRALADCADDPDRLSALLADESITDLDLRHALLGRLPSSVPSKVLDHPRFGTRQTVLGAIARSPSTPVRIVLEILAGLTWRDLADAAVSAELAPAIRQKAEALLLDGLNTLRLGDLITLARIGPRRVASRLLLWSDPRVRTSALHNPRLRETDLAATLESVNAPPELSAEILLVHRWSSSYQVRRAIVWSAVTPHPVSLPLIAGLNPSDLKDLSASDDALPLVSAVARRLIGATSPRE